MLPGLLCRVIPKQAKFNRRTREKHMDVFGLHDFQHPVRFLFADGENNLHRLLRQAKHVGRVVRAGMSGALRTVDHGCAVNAQLFRFMEQPFDDRMVTVVPALFRVERKLIAIHVRLLSRRPDIVAQ